MQKIARQQMGNARSAATLLLKVMRWKAAFMAEIHATCAEVPLAMGAVSHS
jgi:hypothetical protein